MTYTPKHTLFIFLVALAIVSCSKPIQPAFIDNPSDKAIDIYIDKQHYMIPPRQQVQVNVRHGKISLKVNEEPETMIKLKSSESYIINPLKEDYYIENIRLFFNYEDELKYYERHGRKRSKVGAFEVTGDYKMIKGKLLINDKYNLGLDEERRTSANISSKYATGKSVVLRKIHRESDLIKELLSRWSE